MHSFVDFLWQSVVPVTMPFFNHLFVYIFYAHGHLAHLHLLYMGFAQVTTSS